METILAELGVTLDAVLAYELPLERIVDRIGGRRTCAECKAVYHLTARPPKHDGHCDRCDGTLVQRDDDRPEAVRTRLHAYREATEPVREFYAVRDKLISISADGEPDHIFENTLRSLEEHLLAAAT